MDWFAKAAPVGRLGMPADLTPMVCYLLSDAGSFNTGADMVVTGTLDVRRIRLIFGTDPLQVAFMLDELLDMAIT